MHKTLLLAKMLRKAGTGEVNGQGKDTVSLTKIIIVIVGVVASVGLFYLGTILNQLPPIFGAPTDLIRTFYFMGASMAFVFLIPSVINSFYMSNDLVQVLVFPVSPIQIILARIINICGLSFGIGFVAAIPVSLGFGLFNGAGPSFYLAMLLAFIGIPVTAICLSGILIILIMTFIKGFRNKDLLRVIGIVILFGLFVAYYVVVGNRSVGNEFFGTAAGVMGNVSFVFPLNIFLKDLMENFSVISVLACLGIIVGMIILLMIVASIFYLQGAIDMQETSAGNAQYGEAFIKKYSKQKSMLASMTARELKMVGRNPSFLMTGYLYTFGMPLLMGFVTLVSTGFFAEDKMTRMILVPGVDLLLGVGAAGLFALVSSATNAHAITAVSREGGSFYVLKSMPVPGSLIMKAKRNAAIRVCGLASTTYLLATGLFLAWNGLMGPWGFVTMIVTNFSLLFISVQLNMMHDVKHPKLVWESEAQMVKECSSVLTAVILIAGIMFIMIPVIAVLFAGTYVYIIVPAFVLVIAVVAILYSLYFVKKSGELFDKIKP